MNALLESLTKSLTEQGWKVEMQENNQIPAEIAQRYSDDTIELCMTAEHEERSNPYENL